MALSTFFAVAVRTSGVSVRTTAFAVAKAAFPYRVGPTHRTRVPLRARLVLLLKVRVRTIVADGGFAAHGEFDGAGGVGDLFVGVNGIGVVRLVAVAVAAGG